MHYLLCKMTNTIASKIIIGELNCKTYFGQIVTLFVGEESLTFFARIVLEEISRVGTEFCPKKSRSLWKLLQTEP